MTKEKPVIIFQADAQNYELENIRELKTQLKDVENVQVQEIIRREISPLVLFVILILVPLYYFQKGFFTKLGEKIGEKLGDAIGEDSVKAYNVLKEKTVKVIQNTKQKQTPTVEFAFKINQTEISGYVKTDDEEILSRAFDQIEELYKISSTYIKEKDLELKNFVYNLNIEKMVWKPTYYITDQNELYKFDN
jgi:hypothetical protein